MLIRNCAGGVVFNGGEVFLIQNDKEEWIFPKGKIMDFEISTETAIRKVEDEGGVKAEIVSVAGDTAYEFYSISREQPVCNKITWFVMESRDKEYEVNKHEGFLDGGFFPIEHALDLVTYSQDKSLLTLSSEKYQELKSLDLELESLKI